MAKKKMSVHHWMWKKKMDYSITSVTVDEQLHMKIRYAGEQLDVPVETLMTEEELDAAIEEAYLERCKVNLDFHKSMVKGLENVLKTHGKAV